MWLHVAAQSGWGATILTRYAPCAARSRSTRLTPSWPAHPTSPALLPNSLPLAKESRGGGFSWLGFKGASPTIQDCLTAFTADEKLEVGLGDDACWASWDGGMRCGPWWWQW